MNLLKRKQRNLIGQQTQNQNQNQNQNQYPDSPVQIRHLLAFAKHIGKISDWKEQNRRENTAHLLRESASPPQRGPSQRLAIRRLEEGSVEYAAAGDLKGYRWAWQREYAKRIL